MCFCVGFPDDPWVLQTIEQRLSGTLCAFLWRNLKDLLEVMCSCWALMKTVSIGLRGILLWSLYMWCNSLLNHDWTDFRQAFSAFFLESTLWVSVGSDEGVFQPLSACLDSRSRWRWCCCLSDWDFQFDSMKSAFIPQKLGVVWDFKIRLIIVISFFAMTCAIQFWKCTECCLFCQFNDEIIIVFF